MPQPAVQSGLAMPGCVKCVERQLKGTVTHAVSAGVDGPLSVGKHACSRLGHHLLLHLVLLRELALPSGQGLHVTAPGAGAKNPQSQGLQAAEELPVANVPAGHLLQLESLLLYSPGPQVWQVAMGPPGEYVPSGHLSQTRADEEETT